MSERLEKPSDEVLRDKVLALEAGGVMKAYRGRPGCMCGCLGEYFVTEASREDAGEETGHPYEDNQVDDGKVRRILQKIQREIRAGNPAVDIEDGLYYAYVENEAGSRCWAIYPWEPAKERLEERRARVAQAS